MRHIGKNKHTEARYIVVSMALPEDENHCLVIDYDSLPIRYLDSVFNVVNSKDAQQATKLLDVLARKKFDDGSNMLSVLHNANRLVRVATKDVLMVPNNSTQIPLDVVNKTLKEAAIARNEKSTEIKVERFERVDPYAEQRQEDKREINRKTAKRLVMEANAMVQQAQADANQKLEKAYQLDPALRPSFSAKNEYENEYEVDSTNEDNYQYILHLIDNQSEKEQEYIDDVTGKIYKTQAALRGAITRREKASGKK